MTVFDIPRAIVNGDAAPEEYDIDNARVSLGKEVSWEGVHYMASPSGERLTVRDSDGRVFKLTSTQQLGQEKVETFNAFVDGHHYCESPVNIYLDGWVITALEDGTYQVVGRNGTENVSQSEIDEITPAWTLYNSTQPYSIFNFALPGVLGN